MKSTTMQSLGIISIVIGIIVGIIFCLKSGIMAGFIIFIEFGALAFSFAILYTILSNQESILYNQNEILSRLPKDKLPEILKVLNWI